ncbi:ABC transporter ATP-binding protein [Clostridium saccharobutylicum]|uniref:Putative ABC transporter ATP-binding protein n=1 Tax=Clostridium saccharobutylicum TaxID=169679 RepID=A0A1S8N1T6_CLOSA|nr:ABC transporter ATP-binding protein [Clostridium saccharobutylicum]OOM10476.1 putative ABC transporter ATP-binding protein [Clostridium saccharobutylicum]
MTQKFSESEVKVPSIGGRRMGAVRNRFAPTEKPKNTKDTLMRIIKIYMRWEKTIFAAMLLTILSSIISVAIPYFIGKTFNTFKIETRTVDTNILIYLLIVIVCLHVANWLISCFSGVIMFKVFQKIVFAICTEFFEKRQKLPKDNIIKW